MGYIRYSRKDIKIMNEIMLVGTQLTGGQQTIAKWVLIIIVCLWAVLAIILKFRGKDE